MANSQHIEPFPAAIDRDHFGHWLAGFIDGDGALAIGLRRYNDCKAVRPHLSFTIHLRADDEPILRLIQSFFGCGNICYHAGRKQAKYECKPKCSYTVKRLDDLADVVCRHLDNFPLRAKKRGDFPIWRDAVMMARAIAKRPRRGRAGLKGGGTLPQWQAEECETFLGMMNRQRAGRLYSEAPADEPLSIPEEQRAAFASWLSGFADAEGFFSLQYRTPSDSSLPRAQAAFGFNLRADDRDTLLLIQSLLGCGSLTFCNPHLGKLQTRLLVTRTLDLVGKVIPHFERYPLMAKKKGDFEIWKRAVLLMNEVAQRPRPHVRGLWGGWGSSPWLPEEREQFTDLIRHLRSQREYRDDHGTPE